MGHRQVCGEMGRTLRQGIHLFLAARAESYSRNGMATVRRALVGTALAGPGIVCDLGPDLPIRAITRAMLCRWRASLSTRFPLPTRHARVIAVKALFRWLYESGFLDENPARDLRPDPIPTKPIEFLTSEQREELLGHFERNLQTPWGLFGLLVGQTGARAGEVRCLHWRDIEGGVVRLWASKTRKARSVPLPSGLAGIVQDIRGPADALLFPGPPSATTVGGTWLRWARKAGPSFPWTWKILRASYATHLISRGVPVEVVSRLLGHSCVDLTLTHYGHLRPDCYFRRIAELLGDGNVG